MLATRKGERLSGNDEGEQEQGGGRQDLPLLASAQRPRAVEEILPAVVMQAGRRGWMSHYLALRQWRTQGV